jgi:hypothetical protein
MSILASFSKAFGSSVMVASGSHIQHLGSVCSLSDCIIRGKWQFLYGIRCLTWPPGFAGMSFLPHDVLCYVVSANAMWHREVSYDTRGFGIIFNLCCQTCPCSTFKPTTLTSALGHPTKLRLSPTLSSQLDLSAPEERSLDLCTQSHKPSV